MADVLNLQSIVQCPHGGTVQLTTSNSRVRVGSAFALVVGDTGVVAGCPFFIGLKPSPCVLVQWVSGSAGARAGTPLVNKSGFGICQSPEGAPQGIALISNTQSKVATL